VYTIRHRDPFRGWVHGNTTVVIGDRGTFVVDSSASSVEARADIAEIRQWTDKPVLYLLNTHWHQDHAAGNRDYQAAFPALAIVAHRMTRTMLEKTSPTVSADILRDANAAKERLDKKLETGKTADGKPLTDAERAEAAAMRQELGPIFEQARTYVQQMPTLTFDHELTIDLGGRTVEVRHWGRGNTSGDAFAYLPQERILVTGDLLVHPVPYAFDGYPSSWIETLEALRKLDADTIVPGHGEVLRDKSYFDDVINLMKSVVAQVDAQIEKNSEVSLEEVQKAMDLKAFRDKMSAGEPVAAGFFDNSIGTNFVGFAYHELKQR
jgi:glyoxylase-like metal-dependent hydrolase (beta-lactamase superfamily II)